MNHALDCHAAYPCCPVGADRDCMVHVEPPCNCPVDNPAPIEAQNDDSHDADPVPGSAGSTTQSNDAQEG